MEIDYRKELNKSQYEAVTTTEGPVLILAGAGTGKTRCMVYRVAYLIEKGVSPNNILLLTFTNKAANEMKQRAADMLDERCSQITAFILCKDASQIFTTDWNSIRLYNY